MIDICVSVRKLVGLCSNDNVNENETIERVVAGVQKLAEVVQGLEQADFGLDNRAHMFSMFREIVQNFSKAHLIFDELVCLLCDAVQNIASRISGGNVDSTTKIPKTRCDAVLALVRRSISRGIKFPAPVETGDPMSQTLNSLACRLFEHVQCDTVALDAGDALVIMSKAQAVEQGTAEALNRLGDMDCYMKTVSSELGIESDLWTVARKSISHGEPEQTIDATLHHLQSDLRCLRDVLQGVSQGSSSAGGMGRARAWTDNELETMRVRQRNVRRKTSAGHL